MHPKNAIPFSHPDSVLICSNTSASRKVAGLSAVILAVVVFAGCESFLDVGPKGTLSEDQVETPDGVEGLVISAYAALSGNLPGIGPAFFHPPSNWSFSDARSDDAYKGGGGTGDITEKHHMEINSGLAPTNAIGNSKWRALYIGIQRANDALSALQTLDDGELPQRQQRIAEMRFLRGYFYLELKKIYNRVPWIDENVTDVEMTQISNTDLTSDELWDRITADFAFAADHLLESPGDPGRAHRFAAHAFLAKVALFRGQWQEVIQHANIVINSGRFGLLERLGDLSSSATFDNSREDIFSIQHSIDDGTASGRVNWGNLLCTPTTEACGGGGDGFLRPSQDLVNAHRVDENGLPLFETYNEENVAEGTAIDPRLDFTAGRPGIPWKGWHQLYDVTWARNAAVYGPYTNKKFIEPPGSPYQVAGWPWCASALNWPLIRYAELLLWTAEAHVETGNLDMARMLVNEVRERAANQDAWIRTLDGQDFAANYSIGLYPANNWSQEFARQAVRFELRLETALEGHRFFHLVRWGVVDQVLNDYFQFERDYATYLGGALFQAGKHEYMPIPQEQIDIGEGLYQQNPGY